MDNSCGYRGSFHFCAQGRVGFISRYRDENDYCIDGRRVTLRDDGSTHHAQIGDVERICQFELDRGERASSTIGTPQWLEANRTAVHS